MPVTNVPQQFGSDRAAQQCLVELATEVSKPVAVNVPATRGSQTAFVPPSGWTEERLRGFAGGIRECAEAAFGAIDGRPRRLPAQAARHAEEQNRRRRWEALTPEQRTVAALAAASQARFAEIEVERLNVVEPDGTLRLAISSKARAPDSLVDGKTLERSGGHSAGIICHNDEGDDGDGLTFGGRRAVVRLCDPQRRVHLRLAVDATGTPTLEFFDERGRVICRLPDALQGAEYAPQGGPQP